MCGPENTNRPRGGALAALNPPNNSISSNICGDLAFHTPGSPSSSRATHARLTPGEECSIKGFSDLYVVIQSSSGDLTRNANECGLFRQFSLQTPPTSREYVELPLQGPLSLEVGGDGIIGRRVSVYSRLASGDKIVAEGIVGFNFMSQAAPEETSCPSSPSPSL
ncbi:hypothetical protein FPRO06_10267 [Fusarium proliferatum]|uniref:Uncharacterized protein n=1 Tax=Gibberella intermedia TaxID=948311 RepID=A0A365MZ46_GIBIN|nr:hypothetical protein FPRO04_04735 [Fusarium proliferatum]KAG4281362.1 hypothetical protein FPRO06_10267 [Fusarium proliferatum]RBA13722.1 hypothetical protein FPRO05_02515 [Fusarium proliferatum]